MNLYLKEFFLSVAQGLLNCSVYKAFLSKISSELYYALTSTNVWNYRCNQDNNDETRVHVFFSNTLSLVPYVTRIQTRLSCLSINIDVISSFIRVISRGSYDSILAWFITQRNKNTIIVKGWLGVSEEPGNDTTDAVRDRRQTRARPMLVKVNLYSWQLYLPGRAHVEKPCELEIKCRNSIFWIPFLFSFLTEVLKHKPENLLGNLHVKCRFFFWKKNLDSI